ncbi:MAG: Flp pilus assembly complex ATPase component TadA [Patescibacteria group bacterium]|nr:Flp pilus assembly complex ATPase component TadA [Patescibacteria group bacterium]MDE2144629.1 Flp pilus assembly complex ATPase component TadA [Patescibacteria group bacterium]
MDNRVLASALVKNGLFSEELSRQLLTEAEDSREPLEQVVYLRHILNEEDVAKTKSSVLGVPYKKIDPTSISADVLKIIPEETANSYKLIPLSLSNQMLVVGMINPDDTKAQEALRFIAKQNGYNLGVYLITPTDLEMALRRYSPYQTVIQEAVALLNIKPGSNLNVTQRAINLEEQVVGSKEAPIIRIVSSTLKEAVEKGASDIHIEPQKDRLRIRFRLDGDLQEAANLPLELSQPVISRLKIMAELKIDENRIPQDGRFRTVIFGRDIDYRVSTFPTPIGEKMAIRVLDPTLGLKSVDNLGLVGHNADLVKEGINKPFGMVLITGPTGSGKTTTLYALLQTLNKEDVNILSMEDPVEYFVDGINQSQIRPEIGYTFAAGLRQAVRQDPDIIMVGEIRDRETADLAVQAALTGHVVLSTLHTNDAVGVIPRLIDMGIEPFLLPSSLNLMVAQRLVRRLCEQCKQPYDAAENINALISKELGKLPKEEVLKFEQSIPGLRVEDGRFKFYHANGCPACKGKGTVGRVALFEVLKITRELEEIINAAAGDEAKVRNEARRQGMISLRQDGIFKALLGMVSIEEVVKETVET